MKLKLILFFYCTTSFCLGQTNKNLSENLYLQTLSVFIDKLSHSQRHIEAMEKEYLLFPLDRLSQNVLTMNGIDSLQGKKLKVADIQYDLNAGKYSKIKEFVNKEDVITLFYFNPLEFIDNQTIRIEAHTELINVKEKNGKMGGQIKIDYKYDCEKAKFIPVKIDMWDGSLGH